MFGCPQCGSTEIDFVIINEGSLSRSPVYEWHPDGTPDALGLAESEGYKNDEENPAGTEYLECQICRAQFPRGIEIE